MPNNTPNEKFMDGIQIHRESDEHGFHTTKEYKVNLNGKWFLVRWEDWGILDGRQASSSNVFKWDGVGDRHIFTIVPTEPPEQVLPDEVQQFIKRFQETGEEKGTFTVPSRPLEELERDYPGHKWGWGGEPLKHKYVMG